jgi:hypothetical protein
VIDLSRARTVGTREKRVIVALANLYANGSKAMRRHAGVRMGLRLVPWRRHLHSARNFCRENHLLCLITIAVLVRAGGRSGAGVPDVAGNSRRVLAGEVELALSLAMHPRPG